MDQHREKATQFITSYVAAPSFGYAVTHLATHDLTNYTSFDNANELSLFAALAGSTVAAAIGRGRTSRLTLPLVTGALAATAALVTQHSDLMGEAWFLGGTGTFVTESLVRGRRSPGKSVAPKK